MNIRFTPPVQEPVVSTSNQQPEPSRPENLERFNDIEDRYEARRRQRNMDFLRDFHIQGYVLAAAELPFFNKEELPTPTNNSINRLPPVDATFEAMMNTPSTSPEPIPISNPA